jgi:hypothetical protein
MYKEWRHPETKETVRTFSILTVPANELCALIHNGGRNPGRMPAILPPEKEKTWLRQDLTKEEVNRLSVQVDTKRNKTSQNVTSFGGVQYAPFAFIEKGLYMLATVLKSPDAVEATFAIIETFSKLRELAGTMERLNEENVPVDEVKTLKARSSKLFKDVFTDPLPLKMRKTKFSFNFGVMNISIETIREQPE